MIIASKAFKGSENWKYGNTHAHIGNYTLSAEDSINDETLCPVKYCVIKPSDLYRRYSFILYDIVYIVYI